MDFETQVEWNGGYPATMRCQNGTEHAYSAPVEFGGPQGTLSPEDAFIGSANMCLQIVFSGIAKSLRIGLRSYSCRAVGRLETVEGVRKFVGIDLYPKVELVQDGDEEKARKALETAKRKCLVTNSMDLDVRILPDIVRAEPSED